MTSRSAPAALVVGGPPASGKSSLGEALASRLRAALLDQDVVTGPLTEVVAGLLGADGDLDHPRLRPVLREARYETVIAAAVDCLRVGTPVVLVAPFTSERDDPASWARLAGRLSAAGGDPRLVWIRIEELELLRRMQARGARRDRAKLEQPPAYLASAPTSPPSVEHLAVDAAWPLGRQVEAVLGSLS